MLFVSASRWKFDTQGNVYTDANFNETIWDRYRNYCDRLTVILRQEESIYEPEIARQQFNEYRTDKSDYVALPDLYRPIRNWLNLYYRRQIKQVIDCEVKKTDLVIIRLTSGEIYASTAVKCAKKYGKPYLLEVAGFSFESLWHHSLRGKLVAIYEELHTRHMLNNAPYAVYVTERALQKRYPCNGETIACSDVELLELTENVLDKRLKRINLKRDKLILGTAASLDVKLKAQEHVIHALAILKKHGLTNFEYRLVGGGSGKRLIELSRKWGVEDEVSVIGALPHEKIYTWLDNIDIYIQPSMFEGLSRAIIEAMSRACPVLASDVGGNPELISPDCLFPRRNIKALANKIMYLADSKEQIKQATQNFNLAKKYTKANLDNKRDQFYNRFAREKQENDARGPL